MVNLNRLHEKPHHLPIAIIVEVAALNLARKLEWAYPQKKTGRFSSLSIGAFGMDFLDRPVFACSAFLEVGLGSQQSVPPGLHSVRAFQRRYRSCSSHLRC
jgi:hypothetical protein